MKETSHEMLGILTNLQAFSKCFVPKCSYVKGPSRPVFHRIFLGRRNVYRKCLMYGCIVPGQKESTAYIGMIV